MLILGRGLAVSMLPYLSTEQEPLNSSLENKQTKKRGSIKGRSVTNSFHWKKIQVKQRAPRWAAWRCWGHRISCREHSLRECIAAENATVTEVLGGQGTTFPTGSASLECIAAGCKCDWWLPLLCSPQKTHFLLVHWTFKLQNYT